MQFYLFQLIAFELFCAQTKNVTTLFAKERLLATFILFAMCTCNPDSAQLSESIENFIPVNHFSVFRFQVY